MKKILIYAGIISVTISFSDCSFPPQVAKTVNNVVRIKTSYNIEVERIFTFNCSPCHIPSKGGTKKNFDNYSNVKNNIDEIIRRVELATENKDFMPFRGTRLSPDDINLLKKWKADGLLEK